MKYTADTQYYRIDMQTAASGFKATAGTMDATTMKVTADTLNTGMTYADGQLYYLEFTSKHKIFNGGFLKVTIPSTFDISSESTATAQFSVEYNNVNYMSVYAVSTSSKTYIGMANQEMPAG